MDILQVKKYYLLIKVKRKIKLILNILLWEEFSKNKQKQLKIKVKKQKRLSNFSTLNNS